MKGVIAEITATQSGNTRSKVDRVEEAKLSAKKAHDLDPEVRRAGGRAVVGEAEA